MTPGPGLSAPLRTVALAELVSQTSGINSHIVCARSAQNTRTSVFARRQGRDISQV